MVAPYIIEYAGTVNVPMKEVYLKTGVKIGRFEIYQDWSDIIEVGPEFAMAGKLFRKNVREIMGWKYKRLPEYCTVIITTSRMWYRFMFDNNLLPRRANMKDLGKPEKLVEFMDQYGKRKKKNE